MMSKISQKIEISANVLIVIVALLLIGVVVQKYFFAKPDAIEQARLTPTVGKPVKLVGEDFSAQPKTVVLALQTICHFCNDSAQNWTQ